MNGILLTGYLERKQLRQGEAYDPSHGTIALRDREREGRGVLLEQALLVPPPGSDLSHTDSQTQRIPSGPGAACL